MATKTSITKVSKRSAKSAAKQTSASEQPKAVGNPEGEQELGRGQRAMRLDSAPSVAERVEAQRDQLMKALSIVECCKYASATMLDVDSSEYMVPAFETIYDLVNTVAGELERIAKTVECLTESRD